MASLLDMRYKNKNKFKSSCKTAYLVAAATFSAKTAKEHILSLGKYNLYVMDPRLNQQHAGLQHTVLQPLQEVARPWARFKPTLPEKPEVDGGTLIYFNILSMMKNL